MNCDVIFNLLLYLDHNTITKCLTLCKYVNSNNKTYLWKLLCERDYPDINLNKPYYDTYKLCFKINKLITRMELGTNIKKFYFTTNLRFNGSNINDHKMNKYYDVIFDFPNINYLDFTYNSITKISPRISNLTNITNINFESNKIESIPLELLELSELKELYLGDNKITYIPNEINKLKNLRILDLYDNKLTEVPIELSKIKSLKELNLEKNNIMWIPTNLLKIKTFFI